MQAHQTKSAKRRLYTGVALSITGLIAIGLLEWGSQVRLGICLGGIVLCLLGVKLMTKTAADREPPVKVEVRVKEDRLCLGSLQLNNYDLTAYERQSPDGKRQLRLNSSIPITSKQEAALIRYLVLEGFVESLWPEMWGRLEEEASWAFFA
jgi:hypothetical protein